MKIKIISKLYGSQIIDTDTYNPGIASKSSTVFKIIEHIFNEWFDHNTQPGAPMGTDIKGMYFGEGDQPAIYLVSGAIRQGIENLIEICLEEKKQVISTKEILKMDIEASFN